jgi:hypothetical protein
MMLSGIVRIYVLMTTKLKAFTIPGTIYTKNELTIPRFLIRKNVGIRPAFIYMESTKIRVKGFNNTNSRLERAKAIIAVKNTLVTMLIEVLATETMKARGMASVWKSTL